MSEEIVGRDEETEKAARQLQLVVNSTEAVYCIEGGPGMGKTVLAQRVVEMARGWGLTVLNGSFVDGQDLPALWPWRQILLKAGQFVLDQKEDPELRKVAEDHAGLLSSIDSSWDEIPGLREIAAAHRKYRYFEWVAHFLHDLAAQRPLLLVMEDLHNGDDVSLHLLQFIIGYLEYAPAFLLLSWRPGEGRGADRIEELKRKVQYLHGSEIVGLQRFGREEVRRFMQSRFGSTLANDVNADHILAWTGGVPLGVRLYSERLRPELEQGGRQVSSLTQLYWVHARRELSVVAARAASQLALLGNGVSRGEVEAVAPEDTDPSEICAELVSKGILHLDGEAQLYRFLHDELRSAILEHLGPNEREELAEITAKKIEDRIDDSERTTRLLKELYLSSGRAKFAAQAIRHTLKAVEFAKGHNAWTEVISDLERLLARHRRDMDPDLVRSVQLEICIASHRGGTKDLLYNPLAAELLNHYRGAGDVDHLIELVCNFRFYGEMEGLPPVDEYMGEILERIGPKDPRRCKVLAQYGRQLVLSTGDHERVKQILNEAAGLAVEHGDADVEAAAGANLAFVETGWRDFEGANNRIDRLLKLHNGRLAISTLARLFNVKHWALLGLGRMEELRAVLDEIVELNRLYDDPELGKQQRMLYARQYLRAGSWSLLHLDGPTEGQMEFFTDLPAVVAAYLVGDLASGDRYIERYIANAGTYGLKQHLMVSVAIGWMLGVRAYVTGDRKWVSDWSHRLSEVVGLDDESFAVPPLSLADVPIWFARLSRLEPCGTKNAKKLYALLLENDKYYFEEEEYTTAAAKALLALVWGDREVAVRHFEEAVSFCDKYEEKPWRAHYLFELALLVRDGDANRAQGLVDEAQSEARRLGLVPLLSRIEAEWIGQPKVAPDSIDISNSSSGGPLGITRREREILECLVEGLTDKEIAATLNISPYTVGNHLRNIYAKTDCANRGEAAHWALANNIVRIDGETRRPVGNETTGSGDE